MKSEIAKDKEKSVVETLSQMSTNKNSPAESAKNPKPTPVVQDRKAAKEEKKTERPKVEIPRPIKIKVKVVEEPRE